MNHTSWIGRYVLPLIGASLFAQATACASDKPPPAVQPQAFTSVEVTPPPAPPPSPVVVAVSPNVNVSDELAAACKLRFDDAASAPKFDFDQSLLGAADDDVLSQIAKCVTTGPLAGRALGLVGRADPRGEEQYNMALGDRRAKSVRDYLSGLGVNGNSLAMSSRGKLDATGTDEDGWQRDRRVDILLH